MSISVIIKLKQRGINMTQEEFDESYDLSDRQIDVECYRNLHKSVFGVNSVSVIVDNWDAAELTKQIALLSESVEDDPHEFEGFICYQCDNRVMWLAPDSRCKDCTRFTPEEIQGK